MGQTPGNQVVCTPDANLQLDSSRLKPTLSHWRCTNCRALNDPPPKTIIEGQDRVVLSKGIICFIRDWGRFCEMSIAPTIT